MRDMTTSFSKWLSEAKKKSGLSLKQLGDKVGSGKGYMCMIMKGSVSPPSDKICEKLAKLMNENVDYVIYLSYRDKAPKALRDRLDAAEDLRKAVEHYQALRADGTASQSSIEIAQHSMKKALAVMNGMWSRPEKAYMLKPALAKA